MVRWYHRLYRHEFEQASGVGDGQGSLVGCTPWGREESDTTERLHFHFSLSCIGEGNGNPLRCSCLENPRDRGAWWAAIYGVAQSRTWLTWLSSGVVSHPESELVTWGHDPTSPKDAIELWHQLTPTLSQRAGPSGDSFQYCLWHYQPPSNRWAATVQPQPFDEIIRSLHHPRQQQGLLFLNSAFLI